MRQTILLLSAGIDWLRIGFTGLLGVALVLAALAWAVRTRRLNAFGPLAKLARGVADPLIAPIERRTVRFGVSHANAPWWAWVVLLLLGAFALGALGFVRDVIVNVFYAVDQGPRGLLRLGVSSVFAVLQLALFGRVIMSWVGGTYSKLGQLAYRLTEWFLAPLRSVIPTIGMVDISPMVAYFLLTLIRGFVVGAL